MPAFTVNRLNTIGVQLSVVYDAQWSGFEIWAPETVREADIPAYYKRLVDSSEFLNTDVGGFALHSITYEDLKMKGSLQVYVRVVGIRSGGDGEALRDVPATLITRSNTIHEEFTSGDGNDITVVGYPADPQVPFGFDAGSVEIVRLGGTAEAFASYNGLDDHFHVTSANTTIKDSVDSNVGTGVGTRIFLRASATAGVDVRVRAKRPDIDRR